MVKGMGGAMDLVASAENIIVAMMHTNKKGESKLLKQCSLPLTGVGCVKKVVTNLAVLEIKKGAFHLLERAPGVSVEEIKNATEGTKSFPKERALSAQKKKFLKLILQQNKKQVFPLWGN
jgi:3-oxoacid CoA-transferase subunit B